MSFVCTVRPEERRGVVTFQGAVTGTEALDACRTLVAQPGWEAGFNELWDLHDVTGVDVSPSEISDLVASAHALRDQLAHNRVAFVTRREPVALLVRLFELFTLDLGRVYKTFRTRAEADAWLEEPLAAADR